MVALALVGGIFAGSLWGFGFVEQSFFPPSTRPQFMVDLWLPQGTHIDRTTDTVAKVEDYIGDLEGVTHVTSLVGKGGMRFLLTYAPEKTNGAYAQLLVDVENAEALDALLPQVEQYLAADEGKRKKLVGFFVGQVMKLSKGQANPKMVNELLAKKLV